jgi:hypothetical protein
MDRHGFEDVRRLNSETVLRSRKRLGCAGSLVSAARGHKSRPAGGTYLWSLTREFLWSYSTAKPQAADGVVWKVDGLRMGTFRQSSENFPGC